MDADFNRTIMIVSFESKEDAIHCKNTLDDTFDQIKDEVNQLFERQDGEATVEDISKLYAKYGLVNDNGWEQDMPIIVKDQDLAWALPSGANVEDLRNMMESMNPVQISTHDQSSTLEEWKLYPHPAVIPLPDDYDEEDDDFIEDEITISPKRLLH